MLGYAAEGLLVSRLFCIHGVFRSLTYRQLAQGASLLPTTVPDPLHPLQGNKALPSPFWSSTRTALHRREEDTGFDGGMPIAQPDCPK